MAIKEYGIRVTDKKGNGFTRWFNGSVDIITDDPRGILKGEVNYVFTVQNFLSFPEALDYIPTTVNNYDISYILLTEKDWEALGSPIKRFFKKIFKAK